MNKGINLLVIEDKPADLRLIVRHLEKHGMAARCHCVATKEELDAAIEQGGWDVVLSDYGVPKLDFQHTLGLVQSRYPDLPVILVSGSIGEEAAVELLKQGVCDFVLKDSLARLVPAIERSLKDVADRLARRTAEAALRDIREQFRIAQDVSPDGFTILRPVRDAQERVVDFTWVYENATVARMNSTDPQAVVGRRLLDLFPGHRGSPFLKAYQDVAESGKQCVFESEYCGDSIPSPIWFRIAVVPMGEYIAVLAQDVTERRRREDDLARSRDLLANLARLVPGVIYQYRLYPDGRSAFPYSSPGMNDIYEMSPEEVREDAAPVFGRLHPDDRDRVSAAILESARTLETFFCEFRVVLPRQGLRWRWSQAQPERMQDGGTLWYGIISDITDRRRADEEGLLLSTAMQQANDTVVITDRAGSIQYVNPAFEEITGYSRQEAVGLNPRVLKSGKHDAEFYRRMWTTLAAGEVWAGHMVNKRKDGTLYEEDATISPVRDTEGRIVNYVAVKRDVTRVVDLENQLRQAQKMEAVGRLAGGVAHDFNNLLMGIMGYAELCRDRIEPGHPVREWIDEITRDAERSAEITRQLLAFARKQPIALKILDLNDAVGGMLKLLRRLIGEDITLTWRPGADVRPVRLDPSQVDQILANLCVNSRDAIAGVGEITLETGSVTFEADDCARLPDAIPGAYVFLAVGDNGCGMDKETLAQVFEPFFTTKGLGKGTGLGLATVYGIVKQNNGFIDASSEPGKGTTFTIYLPEMAPEIAQTPISGKAEALGGHGETILLVEDEKSLRVTCGLFLESLGYKVLVAETPGEAVALADRHPGDIHLLLTDVIMPGMDGRQLSKRLGSIKSGIKVLFMSGYTSDVIAQRGVMDEGVQFLSKPFTRDDLARKVSLMLQGPCLG